jgi:hypothetical protein
MIREFESDRKAGGEYVSFKISDLYADEKKAQAALVIACEKRLAEWGQEVAEIRKLAKDRKE